MEKIFDLAIFLVNPPGRPFCSWICHLYINKGTSPHILQTSSSSVEGCCKLLVRVLNHTWNWFMIREYKAYQSMEAKTTYKALNERMPRLLANYVDCKIIASIWALVYWKV